MAVTRTELLRASPPHGSPGSQNRGVYSPRRTEANLKGTWFQFCSIYIGSKIFTVSSESYFAVHYRQPADTNMNTQWMDFPGIWTTYIMIIVIVFLLFSACGLNLGAAWTAVHLSHFLVSTVPIVSFPSLSKFLSISFDYFA
jgi:hypothetical protein